MKKNTLNYIVDIIMFILMMAVIGIGFLMKFVLITGQERWIKYGRNVDETVMGLDRHGWGLVHLIVGLTLFAVLVLHLILHWKSIIKFFKNSFASRRVRISFVTVLLVVGALLVVFPFLVNPRTGEPVSGYGRLNSLRSHAMEDNASSKVSDVEIAEEVEVETAPEHIPEVGEGHQLKKIRREELKTEIEVMGYMTLGEVSRRYHVQSDRIKERIGIPTGTSDNERLGQLRRRYGFTMSDVRDAIDLERK
jgi:hypothetical protein